MRPPFSHSEEEIAEIERFAYGQGLDQIVGLCEELRACRRDLVATRVQNRLLRAPAKPRVIEIPHALGTLEHELPPEQLELPLEP